MFTGMASSSPVSQIKRRRDECLNSGLVSPDAKRTNSGTLGYDSDLMAFIEKIDNMDNNEETDAVNEIDGQIALNDVIKFLEDETGLKAQTDNDFETTFEKGNADQMGLDKQGELTADANSEAILVASRFTYYDDVRADIDFFVDEITPNEFGIIMQNYFNGDSVPDIMYSDAVHGYVENTEVSFGSLWEDDIWLPNEHPVIQNDFASPQQDEFGITGAEFYDVWN